ncbi:MAG: DUF4442 domain-containing protein [Anaerolineae bacterium]|nr:DUF4442 domain-containing protein [Anaerolineae bacterium]
MAESIKDRLRRWGYNLLPSYRGSGAWITYLARDWREVKIKLPLNFWTRNYVGTTFCGSMYAAVAPFYMAMIAMNLGTDYLVWDKTVSIQFKKPGQSTLYAHFKLEAAELEAIQADLEQGRKTERTYRIDLVDAQGVVHVSFEEVIYIRRKRAEAS